MRKTLSVMAAVLIAAPTAVAQYRDNPVIELRPFAGISIPTGDFRDLFRNSVLIGGQAAVELLPTVHALGTVSWKPGENKYSVADNDVSILQYDVGLELGTELEMGRDWLLKPFVGGGGGLRSFFFDSPELKDKTALAGYAALGTEMQLRRVAFRLEGRTNFFEYKSPLAGFDAKTRSDLGLSLGVAYHFR